MTDPSSRLFDNYFRDQSLPLGGDDQERVSWFTRYAEAVYLPLLHKPLGTLRVLEVGCGKGLMLRALRDLGVRDLDGVDLSEEDCRAAKRNCPEARIEAGDAAVYLGKHPGAFDVIVMKAVMEHVPRGEIEDLLRALAASLRDGGRLVVEVPNMDWLFATHERYMDFTHRTGFTRESLRQLLSLEFRVLAVDPIDQAPFFDDIPWRRRLARFLLGRLLAWADPQGGNGPIWCRSLVASCEVAK